MIKLIRSEQTKAFFTEGDGWTPDFRLARVFLTALDALATVAGKGLRAVELYYQFGPEPSDYDFAISLGSSEVHGLVPARR